MATVSVCTKRGEKPTVTNALTYPFKARSSTSLEPQPGQVHNSEQDRALGNAPGRAPAAHRGKRNAIVLMSRLHGRYSHARTLWWQNNPERKVLRSTC